jgi:hypothetical protein
MMEGIVSPVMTVASDLKNNPNGSLVALGMLVAFACAGLWPTSKYQQAGIILSLLAGFAVIPSIAPIVPPLFLWVVPYPHNWWRGICGTVIAPVTSGRSRNRAA